MPASKETNDGGLDPEMEIIVSDMETKLRNVITRIIRPTLDQVAAMSERMDAMKKQIDETNGAIAVADVLQQEVQMFVQHAAIASEEVNKRFRQIDDSVAKNYHTITDNKIRLSEVEVKTETVYAEVRRQGREHECIYHEIERVNNTHTSSTRRLDAQIDANSKTTSEKDIEIMEYISKLQVQREELMDDLFGEDKIIPTIRKKHDFLQRHCEPIPTLELGLAMLSKNVEFQSTQTSQCLARGIDLKNDFIETREGVHKQLDDFREDFRVKANQMIAHNTAMMQDIRNDYLEELGETRRLRGEVTAFESQTQGFCQDIKKHVQDTASRVDALNKEMLQDMQEIGAKQKKDKIALDSDLREMRRDEAQNRELSHNIRLNVEYIGRIVGLVLEGERVTNALVVQDYIDRCGERWLGLPGDLGRPAQQSMTASDLLKQRQHPESAVYPAAAADKLAPFDYRKGLAPDSYRPGQVCFRGALYDRPDVLLLHNKLLQKAYKAYSEQPWNSEQAKDSGYRGGISDKVTMQPGANGGPSVGQDAKGIPMSAAKDMMSNGSAWKQMRGSLGQPQAIGSRGGDQGPLGRTEPEEAAGDGEKLPILKLPGISHGHSAKAMGGASLMGRSLTAR